MSLFDVTDLNNPKWDNNNWFNYKHICHKSGVNLQEETSALYKTTLWVKNYENTLKITAHPLPSLYSTDWCKISALKKV